MTTPGQEQHPPPPGWQPTPTAQPSWQVGVSPPGTPPPPGSAVGPVPPRPGGMLGAAHKPGAMPLRPLGLGDIYDAAFRVIRFNPKATVGSAVLVATVAMAIPVVVTAVLTATVDLTLDQSGNPEAASVAGYAGSYGSLLVGIVLFGFGSLLVTGMIAQVVAAAAVGRRLDLGQAWAATLGRRWRLIGLTLTIGLAFTLALATYVLLFALMVTQTPTAAAVLFGILTVPAFLALLMWSYIRLAYLPVAAMVIERTGIGASLRRGFELTRGQFWRTFGIALLTSVIVGTATQILTVPVTIIGLVLSAAVGGQYAVLILIASSALAQVIGGAFATPFTAAVAALQYLDQRIRKEAYDVELMRQAGLLG
jgi:MFS family permease